jgi:hypothetical protein
MKLKLRLAKLYDNGELKRKNTERVKDYFVIFYNRWRDDVDDVKLFFRFVIRILAKYATAFVHGKRFMPSLIF